MRMRRYRSTACESRSVRNCSWFSTDTGRCLIVFATLSTPRASSVCGRPMGDGCFASSWRVWGQYELFCYLQKMGSRPIIFLWLWPATDREPHCRRVPISKIWRQTESSPRNGLWCIHMAGIYSNCSTRKINNSARSFSTYYASHVQVSVAWWCRETQRSQVRLSALCCPWASCLHPCLCHQTVSLVLVKKQRCPVAGKVTAALAMCHRL